MRPSLPHRQERDPATGRHLAVADIDAEAVPQKANFNCLVSLRQPFTTESTTLGTILPGL